MARSLAKKPVALFGTLGTMAAVWWFALRPRFGERKAGKAAGGSPGKRRGGKR